ncbi:hypothetical protein [Algibacter pacificus]|uniref:hypothetical protein n=1 Tax=Algibacter pacificus TaxID=2599389 RepID=UPI0011CA9DBB|nr:hypothetical protein [Algibacter pacificus]
MKHLKILFPLFSFLLFSSTLFSQIKPVKKELKVNKIVKTDIKLRSFTINNSALKVDNIEGMTVSEISGLSIPKLEPIALEVLNSLNTPESEVIDSTSEKNSWEITPGQLIDDDLTFVSLDGKYIYDTSFELLPKSYQYDHNAVLSGNLSCSFKSVTDDLYLLEIRINTINTNYRMRALKTVYVGISGQYQEHEIVDDKVIIVFSAPRSITRIDIKQAIPYTYDLVTKLSCVDRVTSIKIRNITE